MKTTRLMILTVAALALALSTANADFGDDPGFNAFGNACADAGGVLSGHGNGTICAVGGDLELNVPAVGDNFVVDVLTGGTVWTWTGGDNASVVDEGDDTVVACRNQRGQDVKLDHQHCQPAE